MRYTRQSAGPTSPVTLAELKAHLRVDFADDDTVISACLAAATDHLDGYSGITGQCLSSQTWMAIGPRPCCCEVRLELPPVTAVTSVRVRQSGAWVTLTAGSGYVVRGLGDVATIRPPSGASWPTMDDDEEAFEVTFSTGPATCPPALRAALLLMAGHLYANREGLANAALREMPLGLGALIAPQRRVAL